MITDKAADYRWVIPFEHVGMGDVHRVGGKNASLGEMICHLTKVGVQVPTGFATTAEAFREFLQSNQLEKKIQSLLANLDVEDVSALAQAGQQIRQWVLDASLSKELMDEIVSALAKLRGNIPEAEFSVAVRSSATAEDLPDASFAGQQETLLNVRGEQAVIKAVKQVFSSLYNDRAIAYRVHQGFDHAEVALSVGIQRMVRSDLGASGVVFTLDTESGFKDVVFITASYGLGETVVQGSVNPDEFYVYKPTLAKNKFAILRKNVGSKQIKMIYAAKPVKGHLVETVPVEEAQRLKFSLTDTEIQDLARQAVLIEKHYGRPMDIEWGKDGQDGKIYILQARPETVKSRQSDHQILERYELQKRGEVRAKGRSIGQRIGQGPARIIHSIKEMEHVQKGDVLITDMTDPDWEPIMKRASAIVTNRGGRTCHAAIIARELGIPAVVGCGNATEILKEGEPLTVSCSEGDTGFIYAGNLPFQHRQIDIKKMPEIPFKIMLNVGNPDRAFDFHSLPNSGVGLARLEFIINQMIGIHPKALLNYDNLPEEIKNQIRPRISAYKSPVDFYVDRLAEGIATIGAAFSPERVIVRFSDFKSNEYANLIGGRAYEPHEENPMIGFRGASRYVAPEFRDCFDLECRAIKKVRETMGLTNVEIMIPFVRTVDEAKQVIQILAENGLKRGENGLKIMMMCELPANALLADDFLQYFDGYSIGSNDMTQLTLGLDRDSAIIAHHFDERNAAVKALLQMAIQACKKQGKYIGICGQGPSDHPDLALWLVDQGIDSVSLNPDTVVETWLFLAGQKTQI